MDIGAINYRHFLEGNDDGIVEIIRIYKDGLILFMNRYVQNIHIAEELSEETFFKLVVKKPRFNEKHTFKTWLYTIGRNVAINYVKRLARMSNLSDEEMQQIQSDEESLEQSYIREERKILVHRALARIKAEYGQVLYLKFFEDMDNEQIAVVMKKNKRQIENMLYQAKQALKIELKKEGIEYEGL